jgi:biotin transport system substrate-specific component
MNARVALLDRAPIASSIFGATKQSRIWLVVAGAALLTLSAKIQIPWWPVPMTMQTYVVLVIAMGYGMRLGLLTVGSYIALGAMGLPVFAGSPARGVGLAYLAGPTGGYLFGFLVATVACAWLAERGWDRRLWTCLAAMTLGHALIFVFGVAWLAALMGVERAVALGFTPFILATVVKTLLAAVTLPAAWAWMREWRKRAR